MTETTWWAYVQRVAGDVQGKEIADRAGFDKSAITRWKNGLNADPLFVVKFARAYHRPVGEALAASGLITEEEAGVVEVPVGAAEALTNARNDELLRELRRRLDVGALTHARREDYGRAASKTAKEAAPRPRIEDNIP